MASSMPKVTINHGTCISCGLCFNDNCPNVFEEGEDGSSQLKADFRKESSYDGEIEDSLMVCAQKAEEDCPVSAIAVK